MFQKKNPTENINFYNKLEKKSIGKTDRFLFIYLFNCVYKASLFFIYFHTRIIN